MKNGEVREMNVGENAVRLFMEARFGIYQTGDISETTQLLKFFQLQVFPGLPCRTENDSFTRNVDF